MDIVARARGASQVAGSVSANWSPVAYGGMEHHPLWHIGHVAMKDPWIHAHEAAHGWFGDGVRIACWEDFVLSEGTVSYLEARAITQVMGDAEGQKVWDHYQVRLDNAMGKAGSHIAWPEARVSREENGAPTALTQLRIIS